MHCICVFLSAFLVPSIVHGGLIKIPQEAELLTTFQRSLGPSSPVEKPAVDISNYHLNHQHTRSGRCFFRSPSSGSTWSEGTGGGLDVFDFDPRFGHYQVQMAGQEAQQNLPDPIAYQIMHRSGEHLAISPITYLSNEGSQKSLMTS